MKPMKKSLRYEIFRRDGFKCRYCGVVVPNAELHVDHVIPRRLGGTSDPWNLVTACSACNMSKGPKSLLDPTVPEVAERNAAIASALCAIRERFDNWREDYEVMMEHFYDEWCGNFGDGEHIAGNYMEFVGDLVGHGLSYRFIIAIIPGLVGLPDPWAAFQSRCQRELVSNMYEAFRIAEGGEVESSAPEPGSSI